MAATGTTGTAAAAVSLALDQLVFAPTFLAVFIAALFAVEGNAAEVRTGNHLATPQMSLEILNF